MITRVLNNRWVWFGLRLFVGVVFIYAGVIKISAPEPFADSIATFRLMPASLVDLLALGLPIFEVSLGGLLLIRKFTRMASLGVLVLCAAFALALASALLRGLPVDCGCFGSHGISSVSHGGILLGRDLVLGAVALMLYTQQTGGKLESRLIVRLN